MASVSNVAMAGYESRLNSAASVKTNDDMNIKDKDFEAAF